MPRQKQSKLIAKTSKNGIQNKKKKLKKIQQKKAKAAADAVVVAAIAGAVVCVVVVAGQLCVCQSSFNATSRRDSAPVDLTYRLPLALSAPAHKRNSSKCFNFPPCQLAAASREREREREKEESCALSTFNCNISEAFAVSRVC